MSGTNFNRSTSSGRMSPDIQPLSTTGRFVNQTNATYSRPSSSSSSSIQTSTFHQSSNNHSNNSNTHSTTMAVGRSISPIMDRRTRQIQADEGLMPTGRREHSNTIIGDNLTFSVRLDTRDDPPVVTADSRSSLGGRARAGTLPSSWGQNGANGKPTDPRSFGISPIGDIGSRPRSSQLANRWQGETESVPGTPSESIISLGGHQAIPSGGGAGVGQGNTSSALHPSQRSVSGGAAGRPITLLRQLSAASEIGRSTPSPSLQMNVLKGQPMYESNSTSNFNTSATNQSTTMNDLRNRSSSMTTPMSGLNSTPFGPSIFTSSWGETGIGSSAGTDSNTSRRSSTLASISNNSLGQDGKGSFSYDFVQDSHPASYEAAQLDGLQEVHTLDYLGLEQEDGNGGNVHQQNNTNGENRNLLQINSLGPLRNRASTLAAMPPPPGTRNRNEMNLGSGGIGGSFSNTATPSAESDARLQDLYNAYAQQNVPVSQGMGNGMLGGTTTTTNPAQGRNRAGTVAALGGPGGRQRLERELIRMAASGNLSNLSSNEVNILLAGLEGLGLGGGAPEGVNLYSNAPLEGFPRLDVSTPPPLSGRPSPSFNTMPSTPTGAPNSNTYSSPYNNAVASEPHSANISTTNLRQTLSNNALQGRESNTVINGGPSTNQMPSRSLWIGNLNSATTGQELMHAFAPYGAIESLRLLPEKECGFVNFVELTDAVRAREDVLGRLNAKLDKLGIGQGGTVRIGFGKIDALPSHTGVFGSGGGVGVGGSNNSNSNNNNNNAVISGSGNRSNLNNISSSSDLTPQQQQQIYDDLMGPNAGNNGSSQTGMPGLGMADMNVPTRALWVGSIASNVTPATLLSIFTPFGPVESARVLTHKNCGFVNFERVDDAVRARKMLNGREVLGSEMGAMRIGFAKVPSRNVEQLPSSNENEQEFNEALHNLSDLKGSKKATLSVEEQMNSGGMENYRSNLVVDLLNQKQQRGGGGSSVESDQQNFDVNANASAAPSRPNPISRTDSSNNVNLNARPHGTSSSSSIVPASDKGGVPLPAHMLPQPSVSDLQLLMRELGQSGDSESDIEGDVASVSDLRPMMTYYMTIPLVSEVSSGRRYETTKLRETRRGIESGQYSVNQCDQLASEYIDSIVDLASDYIGNTLVQKFFETCSDPMKMQLLHRLAPHLAMVGCHKNGTWAAQKILDCTNSVEQVQLIGQHLRPYIPGLLLDPFGNYVVQCCLPWTRFNDFVFDAMVDRCWEIAQGRFGARSMRACLENENVSKRQRKRVAIAVILNSVPLATSPNGSILLTWLLESPELSKSYRLLAPRFTPHLTHLCTHKLASGTVLRLATQKNEPEASKMILDALFENVDHSMILEEIIVDQVHGSQFITKILSSPTLTPVQHEAYSEQVKVLLQKHQLIGVPAYRRLCEDLGLRPVSATTPSATNNVQQNPISWGVPAASHNPVQQMAKPYNNMTPTMQHSPANFNGIPQGRGHFTAGNQGAPSFGGKQMHQGGPPQQQQQQHDPSFNSFWNSVAAGQGSFSPQGSNDQAGWMAGQPPSIRRNY